MKTLATLLAVLLLLAVGLMPVHAADGDWGVTLDMDTSYRAANDNWSEDPGFAFTGALWGRLLFGNHAQPGARTIELAGQGSYTYTDDRPYLFDVDLLRLSGRYPGLMGERSVFEASAGRFRFSDTTGRVFSHLADGARLRMRFPRMNLRLDAAYTGLQLNPTSDIRMTLADRIDEDDDDEFFGPARAVGIAELVFPELLGPHTVRLGVTGQYDLRDPKTGQSTLNSGHYTLALDGPLFGGLYYNTSGTLMQATEDVKGGSSDDTLGLLAIARLRYFREPLLFSRFTLAGIYASGEDWEFDRFQSISRASVGTVYSRPLSDLIYGEFGYSLRPLARLRSHSLRAVQTGFTLRSYFKADEPDDGGRWYGNEVTMNIAARVFADLGFGITGGIFLPVTDEDMGVLGKDAKPWYFGRFELSAAL